MVHATTGETMAAEVMWRSSRHIECRVPTCGAGYRFSCATGAGRGLAAGWLLEPAEMAKALGTDGWKPTHEPLRKRYGSIVQQKQTDPRQRGLFDDGEFAGFVD